MNRFIYKKKKQRRQSQKEPAKRLTKLDLFKIKSYQFDIFHIKFSKNIS